MPGLGYFFPMGSDSEGYDVENFEDKSSGQHNKRYREGAYGASSN